MDIIRRISIGRKKDDPDEEIAALHRQLSNISRRMSDASRKYHKAEQKQEQLELKLAAAKQKKIDDDAFYARQAKAIERPDEGIFVSWDAPATSFSDMLGIIPDRNEEGEVMVQCTPTSGSGNPLLSAARPRPRPRPRSRSSGRSQNLPPPRSCGTSIAEAAEGAARAVKKVATGGYSLNSRGRPPAAGARYGYLFNAPNEPPMMTGAAPSPPPQRRDSAPSFASNPAGDASGLQRRCAVCRRRDPSTRE
jgi:hypothetical protein